MSTLASIYIKAEVLETMAEVVKKRGDKGLELTISISDDSNQYGQNVSAYVSQSKEEREAKKQKFYAGNGNVFYTDGKIVKGVKPEQQAQTVNPTVLNDDDMPF